MSSKKKTFRRMNSRIDELVNSPLIADDVRRYAAEREHVNRVYAQGLADIRRAGNQTQRQLAEALSTDQGTVSRIERRNDLLLSTLREYLAATGAEHARIVVERDGVEISLDLDAFTTDAPTIAPAPRTYTVASGDTLVAIAERFYGDGSRYRDIAAASGITDRDDVHPGQVLTVP